MEPGSEFDALSGSVFVDQPGLVVMKDRFERLPPVGLEPGEYLEPGDTVRVLDHSSEGYYRLWHNGEFFYEHYFWQDSTRYIGTGTPRNYPGELVRYPHAEWWIRVTFGGVEGWINGAGTLGRPNALLS